LKQERAVEQRRTGGPKEEELNKRNTYILEGRLRKKKRWKKMEKDGGIGVQRRWRVEETEGYMERGLSG
jgi:hypothetical protein